jgi:two-component system chemotaxis response regulator CheB
VAHHLFLIDPAAVGRLHLHQTLVAAGFEITGTAADPGFAWPKLQARWPDAIVLDIDWPRLDVRSFLQRLSDERPTPVVVCASTRTRGDPNVQLALAAGATVFVSRDSPEALVAAVRQVARTPAAGPPTLPSPPLTEPSGAGARRPAPGYASSGAGGSNSTGRPSTRVVAIGISTGGVQSIETVLRQLGPDTPGIVLVQHMPEKFTASFAARLNSQYPLEVLEARDGDTVLDGRVLIAPGGRQMSLRRQGGHFAVEVRDGPPVNHHRPSVDVLFSSVARCAGRHALGIIMTGMGGDGSRGLLEMHDAGAWTAAQDEASSIVFGMPAEAIRLGAADDVLALNHIAEWILTVSRFPGRDRAKAATR